MTTIEACCKDESKRPDEQEALPAVAAGNPSSSQLLTQIGQLPFFKELSRQHLQLLADSAMETGFQPGQWIYRQGDPANRFYLILEGKVIIESEVKERGMIPIRTLGPGDDLGLVIFSLLHAFQRTCDQSDSGDFLLWNSLARAV